jgi:hypothetical protein
VKHALERLDQLIAIEINPQKNNNLNINKSHIEHYCFMAKSEIENIARYLLRRTVKLKKEKEIELLVQQYQVNITLFLDRVFSLKSSNISLHYNQLYEKLLHLLNELLTEIDQRYNKYFNQDQKVPDCYLNIVQGEMLKESKAITNFLAKSIDPQLADIILKPIKAFVKTQKGSITYRQMIYIKNLVKEISQLPHHSSISIDAITQSLIYINFNSTSFIKYAIDSIINELNNATSSEKLELLTIQLKKINLLTLKPGAALYQNKPTTKEKIALWLSEEINFMDVQQTLFIRPSPIHVPDIEESSLHTSLSVQQLALWFRTARDVGMITNQNQSALLKTVARIFKTPHSESISAESLRSKYYIPENGAKKAVKDMLMDMFKQVQKYAFFPFLIQTILHYIL